METIKINKSSSFIKYDDDNMCWEADILFNPQDKEIIIYGTTRTLSDIERNNIISIILSQYVFGNYIDRETQLLFCKLKNRGLEKYEELKQNNRRSYSIIGESTIELPGKETDPKLVKFLRKTYLNLRNQVEDFFSLKNNCNIKEGESSIIVEFYGTWIEYWILQKILVNIKDEYEDALSRQFNQKIILDIIETSHMKSKAVYKIVIKEAK